MQTSKNGWTLIEVIIAMVIVTILVALAYPAYNEQIIKSRRADGQAMLYDAAQREQQFFTVNNSFTATAGEGGLDVSTTSLEGYYTLSITATATSYTLTATRVAPQTADTRCGDLTLNHLGIKGNSDASQPAVDCW